MLVFDGGGEGFGSVEGIQTHKAGVFQVDGAVSALGQPFAQHLLRPRRPGGDDYYFAAVLFFLPQSFFQRIGVRLVEKSCSGVPVAVGEFCSRGER